MSEPVAALRQASLRYLPATDLERAAGQGLGALWMLLYQVDAVAHSIQLVLDSQVPPSPDARLRDGVARADGLAAAAANLAGLAKDKVGEVEALLHSGRLLPLQPDA